MMTARDTIADLVRERASQAPDRAFLETPERRVSYGELEEELGRWHAWLTAREVAAGDRVCLLVGNRADAVVAWLGVAAAGAVQVPLNVRHRGLLLAEMIDDADPVAVVIDPAVANPLPATPPSSVRSVIVLDEVTLPAAWRRRVADVAPAAMRPSPPGRALVRPSDPAGILYTSGTTGGTKGAICSHRFLLTFARTIRDQFRLGADDVLYNCLPQFHSSGQIAGTLLALVCGGTLVMDPGFSRSRFWPRIVESNATFALAMGGMLSLLESLPPSGEERGHRLRAMYGTPAPRDQVLRLERRFGVPIRQNYGSTEQGIVAVQDLDDPVLGSVGRPANHVELVVADDEDEPLPPGEIGNILTRPRFPWTMFSGYWRRPDLTVEARRNLWYHSGDMGQLDERGNLFFVDRVGDVIRRRGENIAATELESEVAAHPSVLEAAAVGVPSPLGEDDVLLLVVPRPGTGVDPVEVVRFCEKRVADFMVPRYVGVVEALPKTASEKVRRAVLREQGVPGDSFDREASRTA